MAEAPGEKTLQGADGLRTLACLMVVFHHLSQELIFRPQIAAPGPLKAVAEFFTSAGSAGVSVFFVLSGFLLAAPFWRAWYEGKAMPRLTVYAARRAGRIVPGFAVNLLFFYVLAVLFVPEAPALVWRYFAGLTFTAGFHYMTFFPAEGNGPLWSIGFEVVSYVLLPLGMAGLFLVPAQGRSRLVGLGWWVLVWVLVLMANQVIQTVFAQDDLGRGWQYGLAGGAKFWMPRYNPVGFFAHFALGIFAAGVAIAWGRASWSRRHQGWFDTASLVLFGLWLALLIGRTNQDQFSWTLQGQPYYFPAFPLLTAALLACLTQSGLVGRAFDNPFSRYTAQVSFGLYLWHTLVISRFNGAIGDTFEWLLLVVITLLGAYTIATLSWKYLEQPFLIRPRRSPRFWWGTVGVFVVLPLVLAAAIRPEAFRVPQQADTAFAFRQQGPVTGLAFTPEAAYAVQNGTEVVAIAPDRTVRPFFSLTEQPATARFGLERPRTEPLATPFPGLAILNPDRPWIWNLKPGPGGVLYAAAGTQVLTLSPAGKVLRRVTVPFSGTFGAMDVAPGPGGLLVASGTSVFLLDADRTLKEFVPAGTIAHQASGLVLDPGGTKLYVCDFDHRQRQNSRVLVFSLRDGRVSGPPETWPAPGVFSGVWTPQGPVFAAAFTGELFRPEGSGLRLVPTLALGPNTSLAWGAGRGWDPGFLYAGTWNGTIGRVRL